MEQMSLFGHDVDDARRRVLGALAGERAVRLAAVGPRAIPDPIGALCEAIGAACATQGHTVISGGAPGADRAFIAGAAGVCAKHARVVLPWPGFEEGRHPPGVARRAYRPGRDGHWEDLAATHHPAWGRVSAGGRALHARNAGVLLGDGQMVALVVAVVRRARTGGTEQTLRIARALGIRVVIIATI